LLIDDIEAFTKDKINLILKLIHARPEVKDLLYFSYGPHQIDLPEFEQDAFGDIVPPRQPPPMDILRQEAPKLLRIFVRDWNPNLSRERRIKIFRDILVYATSKERALLFQIIQTRTIPGITRNDITTALGEEFLAPRPAPAMCAPVRAKPGPKSKKQYEAFRPLKSLGYIQ
jgi:hypothetical protein